MSTPETTKAPVQARRSTLEELGAPGSTGLHQQGPGPGYWVLVH